MKLNFLGEKIWESDIKSEEELHVKISMYLETIIMYVYIQIKMQQDFNLIMMVFQDSWTTNLI